MASLVTTSIKTILAIIQIFLAPFVVLFERPDPRWGYFDALFQRMMQFYTPLGVGFMRYGFAFYGRLQRLVYGPTEVVDSPDVKGLCFVCGTADSTSLGFFYPLLQALKKAGVASVRIFSVEYDLAPEFPYPTAPDQSYRVCFTYTNGFLRKEFLPEKLSLWAIRPVEIVQCLSCNVLLKRVFLLRRVLCSFLLGLN
ncbi:unnamed protein product [Aphanomyces euteiches]